MSEPIKIVDKLTLRQEALRMAVELSKSHAKCVSDTIKNAEIFEDYIQTSVKLPEYVDPNNELKDMMAKWQENFKSNPLDLWFSADSEMKPPLNKQVLVMCADSKYPKFGEYLGEDYWDVEDADVIKSSKDGDVTVIAWMPIHEYKGASK